jgi:predicted transcriptional regulator
MKPYCETVSQYVLPTMRALIAKRLMDKYKLTQQNAALKLGLTQSAVSQYIRNLRGSKIKSIEKDESIMKEIDNFVDKIAAGDVNSVATFNDFCNICKSIRKKKLLCEIHIKAFPILKDCKTCLE